MLICVLETLLAGDFSERIGQNNYDYIGAFLSDVVFLLLSIFLIIKPQKFYLMSLASFYYSVVCAFDDPKYMMSLFMYFLTISILLAFGFFEKKKGAKFTLAVFVFLVERMIPLYYGYGALVNSIIQTMGFSFVYFLSIIFIGIYLKGKTAEKKKSDVAASTLNLALYSGIERSNLDLLKYVQQGKSYKEIAGMVYSTEGSMKNKFSELYKQLEVKDKKEFLVKYGQSEIVFE
ncbi:MAG: hypothetical protein K5786_09875 [Treponema sp.]|nr:hypothetical protein [Treponema sp.]